MITHATIELAARAIAEECYGPNCGPHTDHERALARAAFRILPHPVASSTGERERVAKVIFDATPDRFMRVAQCYPAADAILATRPTDAARRAALEEALHDPAIAIGFQWSAVDRKSLDQALDRLAAALAQEQPSPTDATPAGYVLVPRDKLDLAVSFVMAEAKYWPKEGAGAIAANRCSHAVAPLARLLAATPTDTTRPSDAGEVA